MFPVARHALLALCLPVVAAAQALPSKAQVHRVADSLARDFVAKGHAPSVAIGIFRGPDTIMFAAYGRADLENDVPAKPTSVYRTGSVTKQFTAAAVLQLIEQGKVKLDDSIAAYVPDLPAVWQPVTIRQLLNHTSGIPSYTGAGAAWVKSWPLDLKPSELLAFVTAKPMDFPRGTKWAYNNSGYVLLGLVIEKVAGRSWAKDIEERFAKPLGLADTRDCQTMPIIPRRVHGYNKIGTAWANAPYLSMTHPYAAGAMCSTVGDMAKWNAALHGGKVVSPASYRLMTTPDSAAAEGLYGFGLRIVSLGGRTIITHGGGVHGFSAGNMWEPMSKLSITVLTNAGTGKASDLIEELQRVALGL